jgi:VIT1/CCC1 family predicted Fe2+/Mn2+ transporter
MEAGNFSSQLINWITFLIQKINWLIMLAAEFISEKLQLEVQNVFVILLLLISGLVSTKITEERGLKMIIIAIIIFALLYSIGGAL